MPCGVACFRCTTARSFILEKRRTPGTQLHRAFAPAPLWRFAPVRVPPLQSRRRFASRALRRPEGCDHLRCSRRHFPGSDRGHINRAAEVHVTQRSPRAGACSLPSKQASPYAFAQEQNRKNREMQEAMAAGAPPPEPSWFEKMFAGDQQQQQQQQGGGDASFNPDFDDD